MKIYARLWISVIILIASTTALKAQEVIKLWPDQPPTQNELKKAELHNADKSWYNYVSEAELHIYPASNPSGMSVVICPGGGYSGLSMLTEGKMVAEWLQAQGVTAALLKYRLPNGHSEVPVDDAQEAIRYMRTHADALHLQKNKIGVMGFSAGGHLASYVSNSYTERDGVSSRPDFSILFYPVITMHEQTHAGSRNELLGQNYTKEQEDSFAVETLVSTQTPPALIFASDDDDVVPIWNSQTYYAKLKEQAISAALYIFPTGGHGWGFKSTFTYNKEMKRLLAQWLDHIANQLGEEKV